MEQMDAAGKKIFFLYPHSVIHDEMFDLLIMAGFESYALHDHERARRLLARFPGSIMFINIDEGLPEQEWEAYIREIQESPKTRESRLGILSYNEDRALMQKYLMEISVPCGYIRLKLGIQASTKLILDALAANEARGRRKYIRAFCEQDRMVTMNYKDASVMYYGKVLDISSAGFAAKIEKFPGLPPNSKMYDIQLRLRGGLIMTDAILMGKRQNDRDVWILLFEPNMSLEHKMIIHHFIKQTIQRDMDELKV
jgi:L-rhamnose mutarotase